jgi:small subunit ribosomal protein S18
MSDQERRNSSEDRDRGRGGRGGGRPPRRGGRRGSRRTIKLYDKEGNGPTYKDPDELRRFINEEGKIRPRRQTNLSAKDQRRLAQEIKRARHLALLPYTGHQIIED